MEAPPDLSIFDSALSLNDRKLLHVTLETDSLVDRKIRTVTQSEPVTAVGTDLIDMGVDPVSYDLSGLKVNTSHDDVQTKKILPKSIPELFIRTDLLSEEMPHLPNNVKVNFTCQEVFGTYRIYVGKDGAVYDVDIVSGIPGADFNIISSIKKWKYRPQKQPMAFVKEFAFFVDGIHGCKEKLLFSNKVKGDKLSNNDDPHLSNYVKERFRGTAITCSYKICVEIDGNVKDVSPIKSVNKGLFINGEDEKIMETIKLWWFKRQERKTCYVQIFEFNIS